MVIAVRRPVWDPFALVRQLDKQPNRGFDAAVRRRPGAADIRRDGDDVVITVELPDASTADDVQVELADGRLVVGANRRGADAMPCGDLLVRETRRGTFRREFALMAGTTVEQVCADYDHGLLTLRVRDGAHLGASVASDA